MTRVLVAANGNFMSHTSRALEVSLALRKLGAEVIFAGNGPFMALPRDAGLDIYRGLYTEPKTDTLQMARSDVILNYDHWKSVLYRAAKTDLDAISRYNPDVVVGDMRWSLAASSLVAQVPYVSITNAAWAGLVEGVTIDPQWLGARWALQPFREYAQEHRLSESFDNLFNCVRGTRTLLADLPWFMPARDLSASVEYVGPILWQPPIQAPEWLDRLDPGVQTIYVTMGSTGTVQVFEQAVWTLVAAGFQVLVTTGGALLSLPTSPRLFVADFAPGHLLMERSHVVIHHGGSGTIYQAIAAGRPMVGIATMSHVDQAVNLQRMRELNLGVSLTYGSSSAEIVAAVDRVLTEPKFAETVSGLHWSAATIAANAPMLAAHRILDCASSRPA